jgi:hypothetical protein
MIASFLSRKAEEFPEVFDNAAPNPYTNVHVKPQFIDIVTR